MGNAGSSIEDFFTEELPDFFTGGPVGDFFGGIGDIFKFVIEFFRNIGALFRFLFFLINNFADLVYGAIVFTLELAKEFVELLPFVLDIIDHIIDMVDYVLGLVLEYWKVPVAMVFLIPGYIGMFFVVTRLNSIFD